MKQLIPLRRTWKDRAWINLLLGSVLAFIISAMAYVLYEARCSDLRRASVAASNISTTVTQDIQRNLELYDLSIQGVIDGVNNPAVMAAPADLRRLILFDRAATAHDMGALLVLDRAGNVVVDSISAQPRLFNYADRDYFKIHVTRSDQGLYISRPLVSRSRGDLVIALSRRINNPDGSFGGVVVGTLKLDYIHKLFDKVQLGKNGSMTLFRNDGTVLMREPFQAEQIGLVQHPAIIFEAASRAVEGDYQARSVVDGLERFYHFHRVGDFPLVQNVGLSVDEIYRIWWERASAILAVIGTCCGLIICLTTFLKRELNRRIVAETALVQLVEQDGLTGIANRRCFDRVLASEWQRGMRQALPLSLLMIDADQFKLYNDSLGHAAGDQALKALATCIQGLARRPGDLAARYGGEEFAVILPTTDAQGAVSVAEALRREVMKLGISHPKTSTGQFTVSIGTATIVPRPDVSHEDLMAAADGALYRSKAEGRNRVTSDRPPLRLPLAS